MLGTVQFGLNYGIANQHGQPEYRTCRDIVACALESGINGFDTAAAYGVSEQVLGRVLAELKATDQVLIVSKCRKISELPDIPAEEVADVVEESLRESLRNLGVTALPVFLFHDERDVVWMDALRRLQAKGLVGKIGVSADTVPGAGRAVGHGLTEAVQIPHNLLDRRFSSGPFVALARDRNLLLFARSPFLQGLLLMPEARIPGPLRTVVPVRRQLEALARQAGMAMSELCLRYSLSVPAFTSLVIGVDSVVHLRESAASVQRGPLDEPLLKQIQACVPDFPESLVRPACWRV